MAKTKIVAVVGPTASGKSGLAMQIAKHFDGEIIAADSQTVRKSLDIGTAKPTKEDRSMVKHHLVDVIEPYERFTVGDFKRLALNAIDEINSRNKLAIMVGGSGLYIDSVLYDFSLREVPDKELRQQLESYSVEKLQSIISEKKLAMPANLRNPRHLIRVIETAGAQPAKSELMEGCIIVGINPPKEVLSTRIKKRIAQMMEDGLLEEVERILQEYGEPPQQVDAIAYRIALDHRGSVGAYDANSIIEKLATADKKYAKRQMSWFKRNKDIRWFEHADDANNYLVELLSDKA